MIKVKLHGAGKLTRLLDRLEYSVKSGGVMKGMHEAAIFIQRYIRKSMRNTPRSDRVYKRGASFHRPSKPLHPPAIDSGNLFKKILVDKRTTDVEVGAQAGAYYAQFLEDGTSKMIKRPFVYPAYENNRSKIKDIIYKNIKRDIKR